jgi:zinc-binding alcohol dehydrogenase family protein
MKVIIATGGNASESAEAFREAEMDVPKPEGRDLAVKIEAVGVNPVDTKIFDRLGAGEERVLGWDVCGVVAATGPDAALFSSGQRVFYAGEIRRPGGDAEYQLVDERLVGPAPESFSPVQAAAMPLTSLTAWEGLFDRLGFIPAQEANAGRVLLVIGGAGGVGSMLIQFGAWSGLRVIATAGRPESADWCRKLGASMVIDRKDIAAELKAAGVEQVDAIYCTTHMEEHWAGMAQVLAPQGGVCLIDDPSGPLDITLFKPKSARICWEYMFARAMFRTEDMARQGQILGEVARLAAEGTLRTTLNAVPLQGLTAENVQAAHVRQRSGAMIGKQVISV